MKKRKKRRAEEKLSRETDVGLEEGWFWIFGRCWRVERVVLGRMKDGSPMKVEPRVGGREGRRVARKTKTAGWVGWKSTVMSLLQLWLLQVTELLQMRSVKMKVPILLLHLLPSSSRLLLLLLPSLCLALDLSRSLQRTQNCLQYHRILLRVSSIHST